MNDYHVHPNYSIDADGSVDELCQAAIAKGLEEIAFTTHIDTDPETEDCIVRVRGEIVDVRSGIWLEDYENTIQEAGEKYKENGLTVLLGAELDIYPGVMKNLPERFLETEWDLVIGSVHLIDHKAISLKKEAEAIYSRYSVDELGDVYFSILLDTIETSVINVLGHLDLYRRFGEDFYGKEIHELWQPHIDTLAERMQRFCVGFEVNTSSWRKGQDEPLPSTEFIKALADRGVDIITLGSDAHSPSDVGVGINRALNLVKNCCGVEPVGFRKGESYP